ncbi:hypothetical protein ACFY0G_15615 [Streptomyces sp. NPDC001552]|uniref:hypothetical protein n=1 Tax=Streptomyces sp. NPDC001552 TaxID=3364587 RepID=UPI00369AE547
MERATRASRHHATTSSTAAQAKASAPSGVLRAIDPRSDSDALRLPGYYAVLRRRR